MRVLEMLQSSGGLRCLMAGLLVVRRQAPPLGKREPCELLNSAKSSTHRRHFHLEESPLSFLVIERPVKARETNLL